MLRLRTRATIALLVCLVPLAAGAQDRDETFDLMRTTDLPGAMNEEELATLEETLRAATVPVRTVQELPRGYRPPTIEADGIAVLVSPGPDEAPLLVTSHFHVAIATTVEVFIDGQWHPATIRYGTPLYDLAALVVPDATFDGLVPLPVAQPGGLVEGTLVTLAPVTEDDEGALHIGALGPAPEDDYAFYARSLLNVMNGYPLMNRDGALVAITSLPAPDGDGGVFAVPEVYIRDWLDNRDELVEASPLGFEPRVTVEPMQLTTGSDALGTN